MLPENVLPPDTAAGVYMQLPGSAETKFLGAIANEKPSAIFKVNLPLAANGGKSGQETDVMIDAANIPSEDPVAAAGTAATPWTTQSNGDQSLAAGNINLGIAIEPIASIQAQMATLQTQVQSSSTITNNARPPNHPFPEQPGAEVSGQATKLLAQRIIKDAFNFLASFAGSAPNGQEVVPLKSFQDWWSKFERRVENDPHFLEKGDS